MKKVLLSAFACDPTKGSEPNNGYNWAIGLANEGFEVHCLTRIVGKNGIEKFKNNSNVHFHYIKLPFGLERLYSATTMGMYLYYMIWQWVAYRYAFNLNKKESFTVAHHVTWGSVQMGTYLYKLNIPLIFGPVGGGQKAPLPFKKYFGKHWQSEIKRNKVSKFLLKFNTAFKKTIKKSSVVLASNYETLELLKYYSCSNPHLSLDVTLPKSFFPKTQIIKKPTLNTIKLLWVGRFMPRKGLMLLLDVMNELKHIEGISLTVVGDGYIKDDILSKINEYNLQDIITLVGKIPFENVKDYYTTHDVFIFTSLRDSGGMQILEAMSYGLPTITINLHGQRLIVNNNNGIVCSCNTPEETIKEIKKAILLLLNNPALVEGKSKKAYEFAMDQTWDKKVSYITNNFYPKG